MDTKSNTNIKIDDNNILDLFIESYLLNENYFLNFEEKFISTLPNPTISRNKFINFKKSLATRVRKPDTISKIRRFESLNKSVILKDQTEKLIKLENNDFSLREKVDNLTRIIENNEKGISIEFEKIEENLTNYINELLNSLNNINTIINNINTKLDKIINIVNHINTILNKLENIENNLINLNKQISNFKDSINNNIKNNLNNFKDSINNNINEFKSLLTSTIDKLLKHILDNLNELKGNLRQYIFNELTEQTTDITTSLGATLTLQLGEQTTTILTDIDSALIAQISELNIKLSGINRNIEESKNEILTKINDFIENILKNKIIESIKEWYEQNENEMVNNITNYICERIVGESYIKYDACNLYLPTLIFKFKTDGLKDLRKYFQLKLRLNYKSNEITESFINELKIKIRNFSNIKYMYGGYKGVYVGENRLFKTTIFSINKEEIIKLLNTLIPLTNTKFIENNISYIENSKRTHNIRRINSLNKIKVNEAIDKILIPMCLSSVYLQINGLERQIKLY